MFKFLQKSKNTDDDFLIKKREEVSKAIDENIKIAEADIENIKNLILQNEKYKTDFLIVYIMYQFILQFLTWMFLFCQKNMFWQKENMKKNFFAEH
jgi:nitrogen fixation/metabolism regulation signal transduction histidine kinase